MKDLASIKILRRHVKQTVLKDAGIKGGRVAIVAIWPRLALRRSVQRLLNALRDENWSIVLVLNESSDLDQLVDEWIEAADVVIRRPNVGRDFGAYQSGYRFLRKTSEYRQIEKLAFFNDSVLYPPRVSSILRELLNKDAPIAGFFLNNHIHVHIQSFSVVFGAEVVQSAYFAAFWASYFPSNIRRSAIHKGEVRLSQLVLQRWHEGDVVVTYERLMSAEPMLWSKVTTADRLALRASIKGGKRFSEEVFAEQNSRIEYVGALAKEALSSRNVSHAMGLISTRVLGTPLKLDLVRRGFCTPSDLRETLDVALLDEEEISALMKMLLAGGTDASISTFERQKIRFGFSA